MKKTIISICTLIILSLTMFGCNNTSSDIDAVSGVGYNGYEKMKYNFFNK